MTLLESPGEPDGGERGRRGVFYGWRLVVLIGFVLVAASGVSVHQAASGIWGVELGVEFDWTVEQMATAVIIPGLLAAPLALAVGNISDRIGPRRTALTGLCILAGAFFFFSQIQNLYMLYAAAALMGVGTVLSGWIPMMTVLCRWFVRRRATAIGGAHALLWAVVVVLPAAMGFCLERGWVGWRVMALLIGGGILVLAVLVWAWLRNRPGDRGLPPDGNSSPSPPTLATESAEVEARQSSFSTSQSLRTRAFWFIVFGAVLAAVSVLSATKFLWGEMSNELRFSSTSLTFYTVYVSVTLVFYLVGGFAGDRFPKFAVLVFFTAVGAAGMALLGFANGFPALCVAAAVLGIGVGGLAPVTIAIIADYFGMEHFGRILGVFTFLTILPLAAGGALVAAFLDWYGGELLNAYRIVFLIQAGCGLLAAWCFLKARPPQAPNTVAPQTAADQQTDG